MGKRAVYIVDDDKMICNNIALHINAAGYLPKIFCNATDFLNYVKPQTKGCIILDIHMPGMDGMMLQKKLVLLNIQMRVIFLTAHADVKKCVDAMNTGAIDFLEKPFVKADLLSAIERAFIFEDEQLRKEQTHLSNDSKYSTLTNREKEVLVLITHGYNSTEIAEQLGVKSSTVIMHRKNMYRKLDLHSIAEVVNFANTHSLS